MGIALIGLLGVATGGPENRVNLQELASVKVASFDFQQTPLSEFVAKLHEESKALGNPVNIVLLRSAQERIGTQSEKLITLQAESMSLFSAIVYAAEICGYEVDFHSEAIVLGTEVELTRFERFGMAARRGS